MQTNTKLAGTGGIALAGALMYSLDPNRGRRRRHLLRDQVAHARRAVGDGLQQENWVPAVRLVTSLAGAAGLLYALRRRAVDIQKTVTIDAPPARVYAFLTEWEQWPQWMSHVREVTPRGTVDGCERTHWVVDGPLGVPVSWDAITTNLVSNEEIGWKTVPGAAVEHAAVIRLAPEDGATRVEVWMSYNPPAGVVGYVVAASVGRDPKRQMDADLVRLKTTIETGRPPHGAGVLD